jgi:hypothetical protein
MTALTSFVCALTLAGTALPMSAASVRASPHPIVLRGGGWTLTLTDYQTPSGQSTHGSITHLGHAYIMQGDVIPTVDEPQWLLRFYGPAYPGTSLKRVGLISVAVLISACPPTCPHGCIGTPCPTYQSDWYLLKALSERTAGGWTPNGRVLWTARTGLLGRIRTPPVLGSGALYVQSYFGGFGLLALDPASGRIRWRAGACCVWGLAGSNGLLFAVQSHMANGRGRLDVFRGSTGQLLREVGLRGCFGCAESLAPRVFVAAGIVYVYDGQSLIALHP